MKTFLWKLKFLKNFICEKKHFRKIFNCICFKNLLKWQSICVTYCSSLLQIPLTEVNKQIMEKQNQTVKYRKQERKTKINVYCIFGNNLNAFINFFIFSPFCHKYWLFNKLGFIFIFLNYIAYSFLIPKSFYRFFGFVDIKFKK